MPLCAKCDKPFACHCSGAVRTPLAAVEASCPVEDRPGAIWVHVVDDRGIDVKDVSASNDAAPKLTDPNGVAVFDPVPKGPHKVDLVHSSIETLKLYQAPTNTPRNVTVAAGEITYVAYDLVRKPTLKVKVVEKGNHAKVFEGATVSVAGAASPPAKPSLATGLSDFGLVAVGDYEIKVDLKSDDQKTHATTLDFRKVHADLKLAAGHEQELIVEAEPLNIVTPKIELEYKLVILDRKLYDSQSVGETKITPGATRVELSVTQTQKAHPFTKTGKFEAPNADVFTDEACTKPLTVDLTAKELTGDKPKELWLRGKTEGIFEAKLTLEADPADRFVKLAAEPAKEEMGVVKLDLQLHQQDIATLKAVGMQVDPDTNPEVTYHDNLHIKAMPAQKLMTPVEKIGEPKKGDAAKPGRLLHAQKDGHFSRARLVVAKIDPAHLPAGTDDYDIVLKLGRGAAFDSGADAIKSEELQGGARDVPNSGSIAVFDAETVGTKQDNVSFKVSVLKNAEQVLWVEGTTETDNPCEVRLDMGMDRTAAGLAKTVKRNGDWARFTVVKIATVELVDDRQPGTLSPQRWNATDKEFYINLMADPDGRKLKIAAKLTKPLKNVRLHFMLAQSQNNRKAANWGVDMPGTWIWKDVAPALKHLDKADRKDFMHQSEPTDADGKAVSELRLSRFGGDKFKPGVYMEQDAILAKYIEGHAQLDARKPVLGEEIIVSRKFWTQLIEAGNSNPGFVNVAPNPGFVGAIGQYERVKSRMAAAPPVRVTPLPAGCEYPKSMIQANGPATPGFLISNFNKTSFFAGVAAAADMPVKIPIVICDAQWDGGNPTLAVDVPWAPAAGPITIPNTRLIVKPYLDGTPTVTAGTIECRAYRFLPGFNVGPTVTLTDADINLTLNANGDATIVTVTLPAAVQAFIGSNTQPEVRILGLTMKAAMGPYLGESFGGNILSVWDATQPVDFQNTIVHELGHFFGHTSRAADVTNMSPAGIPAIPTQYLSWLDITDPTENRSSGSHCNTVATPYVTNGRQGYRRGKCVMYEAGPVAGSYNRYCDTCHPYMLVTRLAK